MMSPVFHALFLILCFNSSGIFAETTIGDGCTRGDAQKIFPEQAPAIKSETFEKKSRVDAVEHVEFVNGEKVTIRNGGCEYYTVSFHYESKLIAPASSDPVYWFQTTAEVLKKLSAMGARSLFDEELASQQLLQMIERREDIRLGQQIPVAGDGEDFLQTRVCVQGGGAGFVQFDLLKGPL